MKKTRREDIHIISRHSNWSAQDIDQVLHAEVYSSRVSWLKFLKLFFLGLGVSFTLAGIIFFFAYNWQELHKFTKLGLLQGLLIVLILIVLFTKTSGLVKNVLLTAASILVGVLFAVFGQIYQTGANAYDFFLGWTLFVFLWVLVANFPPLWLIFVALLNTTVVLYKEQVAYLWSSLDLMTILFLINALFFVGTISGTRFSNFLKAPSWLTRVLALLSIAMATIGITMGIFEGVESSFWMIILLALFFYAFCFKYGLKHKSPFYLSIIALSVIVIVSSLLIKISDDAYMFFVICFFVVISITLVIKTLLDLQKKWNN